MVYKKIKGELVEFYTKDKCQLHGFLVSNKNKNVIIYIHGMGGNFYRNMSIKMTDIFLRNGFDLFSINTRGHDGIARVKIGEKKKEIGTNFEKFEDSVYDIKASIKFLSNKYKNIILAGHSTGCQKIVYYLHKNKDKRIKTIILLAPADDYNLMKTNSNKYFKILGKKLKKNKR